MKIIFSISLLLISLFVFSQEWPRDCVNPDTFKLSCFNTYKKNPKFYDIKCQAIDYVANFLIKHPDFSVWIEIHIDTAQSIPVQ